MPHHPKVPEWEHLAAATGTLLLLLHGHGWGAIWRTGTAVDAPQVRKYLGLAEGEQLLGGCTSAPAHVRLHPGSTAARPRKRDHLAVGWVAVAGSRAQRWLPRRIRRRPGSEVVQRFAGNQPVEALSKPPTHQML
ncbi:nitroreductase family protein [Streptomyces sp. NPDC002589]|uniref:nitroreductase family protein n=1 Tax=Streptomyces sp. NPDC002589 TaxID=3154420 RepID=UPI00332D2A31